ncbi:MAG: kelch repeat-containing protein [Nanoarchaeota archaeon]
MQKISKIYKPLHQGKIIANKKKVLGSFLAPIFKLSLAIAILIFVVAIFVYAGDVIVDSGKLNVSNNLFVDGNGNVGIGTTALSYLLQVGSGIDGKSINLSNILFLNGTSGFIGLNASNPNSSLDIVGAVTLRGTLAQLPSTLGQGRIYYDAAENRFKVSENKGAYANLIGAGGSGAWAEDIANNLISPIDLGRIISIGTAGPFGAEAENVVTKISTLPSPRSGTACAAHASSNKIYCFGGANGGSGEVGMSDIIEYDPSTDTRIVKTATLPSPRGYSSCVANPQNNKIYCFGGESNAVYTGQILEYTPSTDTLATKTATLPSVRAYMSCSFNPANSKIYCFGGFNGGSFFNQILEYTPSTDTLVTKAAILPSGTVAPSCDTYSTSQKIYCFGGWSGFGSPLSRITEYAPSTDTLVTKTATLPTARGAPSCARNPGNNKVYCFGGLDVGSTFLNQIVEYDPATDSRAAKSATLPGGRDYASCAVNPATNKIYCFGGANAAPPGANQISQIIEYTITTPSTGRLVVAGGNVDVTNNRIVNLASPIDISDAATKKYVDDASVGGGLSGWTEDSGNNKIYTTTVSRNVGIGTTNPTYGTLEVAQGNDGTISVISNTVGDWIFRKVRSDGSNGMGIYDPSGFGQMALYAAGSERMRIDSTGNVGIGTASPNAPLEVKAGASNDVIRLQSTAGNYCILRMSETTTCSSGTLIGTNVNRALCLVCN